MNLPDLEKYNRQNRKHYFSAAFRQKNADFLQELLQRPVELTLEEVDDLLGKAITEQKKDFVPVLLEYKKKNFTELEIEEAARIQEEKDLGLRERDLHDWRKYFQVRRVPGGYVLSEWRKEDLAVEIPNHIGEVPVLMAEPGAFFGKDCRIFGDYQRPGPDASEELEMLRNASKGEIVLFGRYPKEQNHTPAPLEWEVAEKEKSRVLLITRYAIDGKPYNCGKNSVTWADSVLRSWLNGAFLLLTFSPQERKAICETQRRNKQDTYRDNSDTKDRVFLLSKEEAHTMYQTQESRRLTATPYALACGVTEYCADRNEPEQHFCRWWLRSPSLYGNCAGYVNEKGVARYHGFGDDYGIQAVRPAIWVSIQEEAE